MPRAQLTIEEIIEFLDDCLDVEFSYIKSHIPAENIVNLPRNDQVFILNLAKRMSATNVELAYQFCCNAIRALDAMDRHMVEAWAMTATDNYDRKGLFPAMSVIRELESFVHNANIQACGAVLEEEIRVLLPFLHGLPGRKLKISESETIYTDTETVYLPPIVAQLEERKENFLIYKASAAFLWAQIQFGTFRFDFEQHIDTSNNEILKKFRALEIIRLEACIERELPGLYRDMKMLNKKIDSLCKESTEVKKHIKDWPSICNALSSDKATVHTTLELLDSIAPESCPKPGCYHGALRLDEVFSIRQKRVEKEKAHFRVALNDIAREMKKDTVDDETNEMPLQMKTHQNLKSGTMTTMNNK